MRRVLKKEVDTAAFFDVRLENEITSGMLSGHSAGNFLV